MKFLFALSALVLVACDPAQKPVEMQPKPQIQPQRKLTEKESSGIRAYMLGARMSCDVAAMYAELVRKGAANGVDNPDVELSKDFQGSAGVLSDYPDALSALKAFRGHERDCLEYGDPVSRSKLISTRSVVETELELISEKANSPEPRSIEELEKIASDARQKAKTGDAVDEAISAAADDDLAKARRKLKQ